MHFIFTHFNQWIISSSKFLEVESWMLIMVPNPTGDHSSEFLEGRIMDADYGT